MQDHDMRIARGAALATALAAPVVLALGGLGAGWKGVVGAALGIALAIAFFVVTVVVVGAAGRVSPDLMLPAALATYVIKVLLIGAALFALQDTTAFNRTAFALAVVAGACVYLVAEVRIAARARIPYVETAAGQPPRRPAGEE